MIRLIINLDPLDKDPQKSLAKSIGIVRNYTQDLGRDGERITITWDSEHTVFVYHGKMKQLCVYTGYQLPKDIPPSPPRLCQ